MNARTFDLTPFHRATIGFEQLFNELDRNFTNSVNTGYPPYNIIKYDEDQYYIELAVAGFSMEELVITLDKDQLIIEGYPNEHEDDIPSYLHKGIANRNFIRTFKIAEHVEVQDAALKLGILQIALKRSIPEELQPKKIAIKQVS
jgi:molecular chaperone IbpA